MTVFSTLTTAGIAGRIQQANERVVYSAPGLTQEIAASLVASARRLPGRVVVILDVSGQCARLGYGQFDAVTLLHENGVVVRQQDGLRIGFLAVDETGYAFNLPPLLVEDVTEMHRACNAIALDAGQVRRSLEALLPPRPADSASSSTTAAPEIGRTTISSTAVEKLRTELVANPPQKFDLARKVSVFNAQVEFVEMSLTGTHVRRHTVQLPPELVFAARDAETQRRVQASFKVVGEDSALAKEAKAIADKVTALRKGYLRSAEPLGSIMLRARRGDFMAIVGTVRAEVDAFRVSAEARLQKEIDRSRQKLVDALLPAVKQAPPEKLRAQVSGKVTNDIAKAYLADRLATVFPAAATLIDEMRLDVVFKGVTYEMLKDDAFRKAVNAAFPYEKFDLLEEFQAAPVVHPHLRQAAD